MTTRKKTESKKARTRADIAANVRAKNAKKNGRKRAPTTRKPAEDREIVSTEILNPAEIPVTQTKRAPAEIASFDLSKTERAIADGIANDTQKDGEFDWYPLRRAARAAGYDEFNSEREFRLIHSPTHGWRYEGCAFDLSEDQNPTFEFFNVEEVRNANLGSLYKCAMSFGVEDV
jgi:hypothetical protein